MLTHNIIYNSYVCYKLHNFNIYSISIYVYMMLTNRYIITGINYILVITYTITYTLNCLILVM